MMFPFSTPLVSGFSNTAFSSNRGSAIRDQLGAVSVEVALSAFAFFLVLGLGLEFIRASYYTLSLQLVANAAARQTALGTAGGCPTCTTGATRADYVETTMIELANKLSTTISDADICIRPAALGPNCNTGNTNDDAGDPRQMFVITIRRNFAFFFGLGNLHLRAQALGKNEPFGAAVP